MNVTIETIIAITLIIIVIVIANYTKRSGIKTMLSFLALLALAYQISISTKAYNFVNLIAGDTLQVPYWLGLVTSTITIAIWEVIFLQHILAPAIIKFIDFLGWSADVMNRLYRLPSTAIETVIGAFGTPVKGTSHQEDLGQDWKIMFNEALEIAEEKDKEIEALKAQLESEKTAPSAPVRDRAWAADLLGIKQSAPAPEIKAQYRKLIKVVHPDAGGSATLFQDINHAYELLK